MKESQSTNSVSAHQHEAMSQPTSYSTWSRDEAGRTPLHTAAQYGELEVVKHLLFADEVPIFTLNLEPGRKLSDALKLISQQLSERHRDFSGNTLLHTACVHGQLDVVKLLTREIGCDPNNTNSKGLSCLHLAARHGHLPLVRYLVEEVGSDMTLEDEHGRSPTYLATRRGHLDILKYFIEERGADPHFRTTVEWKTSEFTKALGRSLLHAASSKGHYNVVRYLEEQCGLDPSCEDGAGVAPLHLACRKYTDIVTYLITEQNCNPHRPDGEGITCLHYACWEGHLDVVRYLINTHHCDPKVEAALGRTPLHFATVGGNLAVIKFLIEDLICDYRSPDSEGCVPLHYACLRSHLDVVKYLVNCDPQARAKSNIPLMFAALNGHMDVVKFLIEDMKCDPNIADEDGVIPLHHTSRKGHLNIVKYLVEICHCDPLHRDSNGVTPLHVAAANDHIYIVRYYIATHHCDPRVKTKHHFTPLDYAAKYGHEVTVKYLLDSYHCDVRLKNTDILRAKLWADEHCELSYLHSLTSQGVSQEIDLFQSDADILSQMSDSVQMVQCARDVMDLIAEIGNSLEYPDTTLSKVQEIGDLIGVLAMKTEGVDITKVTAVSKQLSLMAEFQLRECVEYPDLWPLAVDELLRVIADLAESVRDFIGAVESSNPSHQASASALPPYLNPMAKHSTPQQDQGHRFFRKHLDEVRDTLYEKDD